MINKKLLSLLIGVFFCFFVRNDIVKNHSLKNGFPELNNIEIYIKNAGIKEVREISNKLNQFNDFLSYSYIDPSPELFLHNSLKNSSINNISTFLNIFEIPTFEHLINTLGKLSVDYEFNKHTINSIISELFDFCISENPNINKKIIKYVLNDNKLVADNSKSYKIIAKSNKNFITTISKKTSYLELFKFIESINKKTKIIHYIKFNNKFAYDCFLDHYSQTETEIKFGYSPEHIFYLNDIEELAQLEEDLHNNFPGRIVTQSINDYLTDNSLVDEKYRNIKNIYLNISKYSKQKKESTYDIKDIMKSMSVLDSNISKFGDRDDYLILEQVNFIYKYFKNNQNSNKVNQLVSKYNLEIPSIVKSIANTEPVTIDFVNPFIYGEYFNTDNNKYILKLDPLNIKNFNLYTNFIFFNSSIRLELYLLLINIIISISLVLFLVVIIKRYIYSK